jgi:hypothetical protein
MIMRYKTFPLPPKFLSYLFIVLALHPQYVATTDVISVPVALPFLRILFKLKHDICLFDNEPTT